MAMIPDAPWVRDAEMDGMPSGPEPECPVCGADAREFYLDRFDEICGCDRCMRIKDADEYVFDHQEVYEE